MDDVVADSAAKSGLFAIPLLAGRAERCSLQQHRQMM
jgi:hypothetical protein